MADNLNVTTEQVDDIPILLAQGKKIGVPELLDGHFWPHGNWQGTSFGWTATVWLAHILSEGEHRLNQVEQWVEKRPHTLEIGTGQRVRGLEWSDDRLGSSPALDWAAHLDLDRISSTPTIGRPEGEIARPVRR